MNKKTISSDMGKVAMRRYGKGIAIRIIYLYFLLFSNRNKINAVNINIRKLPI
jgi:hypothetical protein